MSDVGDFAAVAFTIYIPAASPSSWFRAYPEIDVEVTTSSKLPVANLKGDGHFVILVQYFVETFVRVCPHLDVVRQTLLKD